MNLGITTSFFVGGLLLLSILHMNFSVSSNASETTLQMASKNKMAAITDILNTDFNRMAHNVEGGVQVIQNSSNGNRITFQADLNDDGTANEITWEFRQTEEFVNTNNPNDRILVRNVPVVEGGSATSAQYGIVDFNLTYYDQNNNETSDMTQVRQIEVELLHESAEAISKNTNNRTYGRSYWKKRVVPPSLQFRNN